jgi:hypothetical protein
LPYSAESCQDAGATKALHSRAQKSTTKQAESSCQAKAAGLLSRQIGSRSLKNFAAQLKEGATAARLLRLQFFTSIFFPPTISKGPPKQEVIGCRLEKRTGLKTRHYKDKSWNLSWRQPGSCRINAGALQLTIRALAAVHP